MYSRLYYTLKPVVPRWLQIGLRRRVASWWYRGEHQWWPVSETAAGSPPNWPGWPGGARFAVVLTHDVESQAGVAGAEEVANLEERRGFRSAFGFVPLRYQTPERLREGLAARGFEVMVHDLYHDGKLYRDWQSFADRREAIQWISAAVGGTWLLVWRYAP